MRAAGAGRCWLIWVAVVPVALWTLLRMLGIDGGFPLAALMAFSAAPEYPLRSGPALTDGPNAWIATPDSASDIDHT